MSALYLNINNYQQNKQSLEGENLNQIRQTRHKALFYINLLIFCLKSLIIISAFILLLCFSELFVVHPHFRMLGLAVVLMVALLLVLYMVNIKFLFDSKIDDSKAKIIFLLSILCFILDFLVFLPMIVILLKMNWSIFIQIMIYPAFFMYLISSLLFSLLYFRTRKAESKFYRERSRPASISKEINNTSEE